MLNDRSNIIFRNCEYRADDIYIRLTHNLFCRRAEDMQDGSLSVFLCGTAKREKGEIATASFSDIVLT